MLTSRISGFELANDFGCADYDYLNERGVDKGLTYKVDFETNLDEITDHHFEYMTKVGFPFFEKLSTLEGIDEYLNTRILDCTEEEFASESKRQELLKFFDRREVLSSVIVAHLVKNPKLDMLLERFNNLFPGNDYILGDVQKVRLYFANSSST